jgi:hypothetical protein
LVEHPLKLNATVVTIYLTNPREENPRYVPGLNRYYGTKGR